MKELFLNHPQILRKDRSLLVNCEADRCGVVMRCPSLVSCPLSLWLNMSWLYPPPPTPASHASDVTAAPRLGRSRGLRELGRPLVPGPRSPRKERWQQQLWGGGLLLQRGPWWGACGRPGGGLTAFRGPRLRRVVSLRRERRAGAPGRPGGGDSGVAPGGAVGEGGGAGTGGSLGVRLVGSCRLPEVGLEPHLGPSQHCPPLPVPSRHPYCCPSRQVLACPRAPQRTSCLRAEKQKSLAPVTPPPPPPSAPSALLRFSGDKACPGAAPPLTSALWDPPHDLTPSRGLSAICAPETPSSLWPQPCLCPDPVSSRLPEGSARPGSP